MVHMYLSIGINFLLQRQHNWRESKFQQSIQFNKSIADYQLQVIKCLRTSSPRYQSVSGLEDSAFWKSVFTFSHHRKSLLRGTEFFNWNYKIAKGQGGIEIKTSEKPLRPATTSIDSANFQQETKQLRLLAISPESGVICQSKKNRFSGK